jgi:hypothetical protein
MNTNHYCKNCGSQVEFECGQELANCNLCNKTISRKEAIRGFTRDARINQLKAMHELMTEANDEGIYMSWIYLVPDCPSEEDFESIAIDDKLYNECFDKFVKLIAKDGNRW